MSSRRAARTSAEKMAPAEADEAQRRGVVGVPLSPASRSRWSIGRAKGSPTITTHVTRSRPDGGPELVGVEPAVR